MERAPRSNRIALSHLFIQGTQTPYTIYFTFFFSEVFSLTVHSCLIMFRGSVFNIIRKMNLEWRTLVGFGRDAAAGVLFFFFFFFFF
jgi:hypothetical protein